MLKPNPVAEKNKARKEHLIALFHRWGTSPDGRDNGISGNTLSGKYIAKDERNH